MSLHVSVAYSFHMFVLIFNYFGQKRIDLTTVELTVQLTENGLSTRQSLSMCHYNLFAWMAVLEVGSLCLIVVYL